MKTKKYTLLSLIVSFIVSLFFGVFNLNVAYAEQNTQYEQKVYCTATIEDNFEEDIVIVVLDKYESDVNKYHSADFFGSFPKASVEDLTTLTGDIESKGIDRENYRQIYKITLPTNNKQAVLDAIEELETIDGILAAKPSYFFEACAVPNDTYYTSDGTWALNGDFGIQIEDAWEIETGINEVRVGIIDTGIASHPDLNNNLASDLGWDFESNNDNTTDIKGHGTHVAGIIGAQGNNALGVTGVCWDVTLVPIKIGNNWTTTILLVAINYATNYNIDILNYSGHLTDVNQIHEQDLLDLEIIIANYPGLFITAAGR